MLGRALLQRQYAEANRELQKASLNRRFCLIFDGMVKPIRGELVRAKYLEREIENHKESRELLYLRQETDLETKMSGNKKLGTAEQANSYSRNRRLEKDIKACSKEIARNPEIPSNWVNRAVCYYECKDWASLEEDCSRAIRLDSTIVEPHHMLGLALLQRQKYAEGIRELQKALDLEMAIHPNSVVVKRIQDELVRAKYSVWEIANHKESRKLHYLRKDLEDVFRKVAKADKPTEVPRFLVCGITHSLFQEPVITPYGHTYEKGAIIRHLEKNNFDPITRRPLDRTQLVPNLALKEAVQSFLDEHGWAYKEFIDDDDQRLKLPAKRRKLE